MKVLVLGIDGLEYNLVEKWNITGFKQKVYGIHDVTVAVKDGDPLYTPLIWSSFLIGVPSYKFGMDYDKIFYERSIVGYGPLSVLYKIKYKLLGKRKLGIRKILAKLGLFNIERVAKEINSIERLPPNLLEQSLIGIARKLGYKVWVKDFPCVNESYYGMVRGAVSQYFNSPLDIRIRWINKLYALSYTLLNESINALRDNDLVLYYTPLIDIANHMLYRPKDIKLMTLLATYYKKLAKNIEEGLRELKADSIKFACMIISDHGYDCVTHEHSPYGFWSVNIRLSNYPKTILDFKNIIIDLLRS